MGGEDPNVRLPVIHPPPPWIRRWLHVLGRKQGGNDDDDDDNYGNRGDRDGISRPIAQWRAAARYENAATAAFDRRGPVARETSVEDRGTPSPRNGQRMAATTAAEMTASAQRIVAFVFGRVLKGRRRSVTVVQLWEALTAGFGAAYFRRRRNVAAVRDAMEYLLYTGRLVAVAPESAPYTCESSSSSPSPDPALLFGVRPVPLPTVFGPRSLWRWLTISDRALAVCATYGRR